MSTSVLKTAGSRSACALPRCSCVVCGVRWNAGPGVSCDHQRHGHRQFGRSGPHAFCRCNQHGSRAAKLDCRAMMPEPVLLLACTGPLLRTGRGGELQNLSCAMGITVQAGDHPQIDMQLQLGEVSQSVVVDADVPLIDTTNSAIGQSIGTRRSAEDLPLNGRTPVVLAQLALGVTSTQAPGDSVRPFDNGGAASITDRRRKEPDYGDSSRRFARYRYSQLKVAYSPPQDVVQEVKVYAFQADAAYGHSGGGVVNQVTKGGTNKLHGSVYEYNQTRGSDGKQLLQQSQRHASSEYALQSIRFVGRRPSMDSQGLQRQRQSFLRVLLGRHPRLAARGRLPARPDGGRKAGRLRRPAGSRWFRCTPSMTRARLLTTGGVTRRTAFANNKLPSVNPIAAKLLSVLSRSECSGSDGAHAEQPTSATSTARTPTTISSVASTSTSAQTISCSSMCVTISGYRRLRTTSTTMRLEALLTRTNWGAVVDDVHTFNATTVNQCEIQLDALRFAYRWPDTGYRSCIGRILGFSEPGSKYSTVFQASL